MDSIERKAYEAALEEYFAKGKKVTVVPIGERSEESMVSVWGKKKKKTTKEQVDSSLNCAILIQ